MAERLSIVISLPSGVAGQDVKLSLKEDGMVLQIDAPWPSPLQDPTWLCAPFIINPELSNYTNLYPEVIALEKSLKEFHDKEENGCQAITLHVKLFVVEKEYDGDVGRH